MIDRVSSVFQAFSGAGDPAAVALVAQIRAAGVSLDRVADGLEAVVDEERPSKHWLGTGTAALSASSILAAACGSLGLHRMAEALEWSTSYWMLPLIPVPILVVFGIRALLRRAPSASATTLEDRLIVRGVPRAEARAIAFYLAGAGGATSRLGAALVAIAAIAVIFAFWFTYFAKVLDAMPGVSP